MERIDINPSKSKKVTTYLKDGKVFLTADYHIKINDIRVSTLILSEIEMRSV